MAIREMAMSFFMQGRFYPAVTTRPSNATTIPSAQLTLDFRLITAYIAPLRGSHEVRDRTATRHPAVHPGVPAGARNRTDPPGDLRSLRLLVLRHGLQAPLPAREEGTHPPRLESE